MQWGQLFLGVNGFNTIFRSEASAEYINADDLGFGRKMHCLNNNQVSCDVENYLNPGTDKE